MSPICGSNASCPLFAAVRAMALSSPARGVAAARPLPRHSMAQRSLVAAARPSGHGCSRLRAVARVCSPVAAATIGSGSGSWAAPKAAWKALLGLLGGASAGVPEWKWWAVQLGAVALMAAAACKVVDNSAKKEFEERCQGEEVSRVPPGSASAESCAAACAWPPHWWWALAATAPAAGSPAHHHPAPCDVLQPATVMAALRRQSRQLSLRLVGHFAFVVAANLAWNMLVFALSGEVPEFVASPTLNMALLLVMGRTVVRNAVEALWASRMLRHGAASGGGQQPSMP